MVHLFCMSFPFLSHEIPQRRLTNITACLAKTCAQNFCHDIIIRMLHDTRVPQNRGVERRFRYESTTFKRSHISASYALFQQKTT